ncbi:MAG: NAD(P)/FAD-dependent oxidoreductase [Ruthenibacterium sp.]
MSALQKLQKKLEKRFGNHVAAELASGVVTLTGHVETWEEKVTAGRLCADKKSRRMLVNDIDCPEQSAPQRLPALRDDTLDGQTPDVLIIGAGVVGCAIARELARWKLDTLLLEKEHDVALHASGRNDGMVHPGVDLHPWQIKQHYDLRGNAMYAELCRALQVPYQQIGQRVCFDKPWMRPLLCIAPVYWHRMGVPCTYVSQRELRAAEPEMNKAAVCALSFPTAGIVCPYGLTIAYAENAVQNGVRLSLDTAVLDMTVENDIITAVQTNRGTLHPRVVINAAGVFSDVVAGMAGDRFFSIHPRRGTNSIVDKKAAHQIRTIASMMGTAATKTAHTKGGGCVRTVDGNLLVGPDAVETPQREDFSTEAASVQDTFEKQKKTSPQLSERDNITYFTGVRAATYEEDFVIGPGRKTKNLLHAAGIQSPGLTAAPAIGVDVAQMAADMLRAQGNAVQSNEKFDPVRPAIPRAAELPDDQRNALIRENPDFGIVVCRCEEVSRGEIVAALHRPVPCDTVDGVKRRVRPGMGRCQGGFCGPFVAQIIAQELGAPLASVKKSGDGSELLFGSTKAVSRPMHDGSDSHRPLAAERSEEVSRNDSAR